MNIPTVIRVGLLLNALAFFSLCSLVLLEASGERRSSEFILMVLLRFMIKVNSGQITFLLCDACTSSALMAVALVKSFMAKSAYASYTAGVSDGRTMTPPMLTFCARSRTKLGSNLMIKTKYV